LSIALGPPQRSQGEYGAVIRNVCDDGPCVVNAQPWHPRWEPKDRKPTIPLGNHLVGVTASSQRTITWNLDLRQDVARAIEVVGPEELGV
jgi:hypothetical protein